MSQEGKATLGKKLKAFFIDHNLLHYASSLSFHTILALIPIMILSFFIFTQLAIFDATLENVKTFIFSSIMPVRHEMISGYIDTFMQNTEQLGVIGIVFVLYVSVMFFDDFEYVINKIFKVQPRTFWHSIAIYLFFTIMMPSGLGISIFLSIQANILLHSYYYTSGINFLALSSYLIAWFLFLILYLIAPNTKVKFKNAFIASFATSIVWFSSKSLFFYYVTYNKTYTSIYGSFSTIMFFAIWIYLSWILFLFGVKLTYLLNNQKKAKKDRREKEQKAFMKNSQNRREYIQR
ncbi:MAG TPA: YihY family inner membrane protein [Campylobacterales bacterium]|nr:YihY family inner membrane protein [Campylobacterales bacterium]